MLDFRVYIGIVAAGAGFIIGLVVLLFARHDTASAAEAEVQEPFVNLPEVTMR